MIEKRVYLSKWSVDDAKELYEMAKNPDISKMCGGWTPHTSVEHSKEVIEKFFTKEGNYKISFVGETKPIGAISLMFSNSSHIKDITDKKVEIGFWLGKSYWGMGLMKEACEILIHYCFNTLKLDGVYCGYLTWNKQNKRLQEKLGFTYLYSSNCESLGNQEMAVTYLKNNIM